MFGRVEAENENVVEVDNNEVISHVTEDIIHEMLEGCGGIGHSEGHDQVFERAIAGAKGCFQFVPRGNADIVVARSKVEFGKNLGLLEAIEEIVDQRKWVSVLSGDAVQAPIIHTEAEGAVFLFGEKDGSASGGIGWSDEAFA